MTHPVLPECTVLSLERYPPEAAPEPSADLCKNPNCEYQYCNQFAPKPSGTTDADLVQDAICQACGFEPTGPTDAPRWLAHWRRQLVLVLDERYYDIIYDRELYPPSTSG